MNSIGIFAGKTLAKLEGVVKAEMIRSMPQTGSWLVELR